MDCGVEWGKGRAPRGMAMSLRAGVYVCLWGVRESESRNCGDDSKKRKEEGAFSFFLTTGEL